MKMDVDQSQCRLFKESLVLPHVSSQKSPDHRCPEQQYHKSLLKESLLQSRKVRWSSATGHRMDHTSSSSSHDSDASWISGELRVQRINDTPWIYLARQTEKQTKSPRGQVTRLGATGPRGDQVSM